MIPTAPASAMLCEVLPRISSIGNRNSFLNPSADLFHLTTTVFGHWLGAVGVSSTSGRL